MPALAEEAPGSIWNKICFNVATGPSVEATFVPPQIEQKSGNVTNVCLTQADIRDNSVGTVIGRVSLRVVAGQSKPQLLAMSPLGRALRSGALLQIDSRDPIKLQYVTCDKAGCYAEVTVDSAIVDQMKTGTQVSFADTDLAGSTIRVPLPLNGFAKAVDGAPLSLDKYNEFQKRIANMYRRR
jgi:invasion protein IalB